MTPRDIKGGPAATGLAAALKRTIMSGAIGAGDFLPSVRRLSRDRGLSPNTVYKALRTLVAQGLVSAEVGRGYRVLSRAHDPAQGCPLAFLLSARMEDPGQERLYMLLSRHLQTASEAYGWSVLNPAVRGLEPEVVIEHCRMAHAWGLMVDIHNPKFLNLAEEAGLPVVMIDAWHPGARVDAVVQDGFGGGQLAVQYLADRGHQAIAWFGPVKKTVHARSRFGGAISGLAANGIHLAADSIVDADEGDTYDLARRLFRRKHRPTAVLALWQRKAMEVERAAREAGLAPGKDVEIVGWSAQELYEDDYVPSFPAGCVPPTVVWSIESMAQTAVSRLADRRAKPGLPAVRMSVETTLKLGAEAPGHD